METMMSYGNKGLPLWGEDIKARKKVCGEQIKQVSEGFCKLTHEEQERWNKGMIRYAVTGEIPPFYGNERHLFGQLMELKDRYRDVCDPEGIKATGEREQASHAEKKTRDACHDNDSNIYNYINNYKIQENTNISTIDHDNDTTERENLFEKEDSLTELSDGPEPKRGEEGQGNKADRVIRAVESLCGMTCFDYVKEEIAGLVELLGEELCLLAVKRAEQYKGKTWGYIRTIMEDWYRNGIRTLEEARGYSDRADKEWKARKYGSTGKAALYSRPVYPKSGGAMYQRHGQTALSELEREAIASALLEG